MAITVQIEDEGGTRIGELWLHPLSSHLFGREHPGTSCVRFIDLYGDTIFNQLQIPVLIAELTKLEDRLNDGELRLALRGLIHFIGEAVDQVHIYVRFIGD